MPAATLHTAAGAFIAGLATSLHCAGMCGPVACTLLTLKKNPGQDPQTPAALYHIGRILSYASLGALAGALGKWPLTRFTHSPLQILPWLLAIALLAIATGLTYKLPRPLAFKKWATRTRFKLATIPVKRGALALGLATPLLPCGPLYLMLGIALASGSALRGVEFMLAFTLGTIPLLWLAQHQIQFWNHRLTPAATIRLRRGLAFVGALLIFGRLWAQPADTNAAGDPTAPDVSSSLCHGT
ncbi:MAG: hypothetical protein JWL81_127 [Verrucomicrobiales bacterium]|nr:hypothetical protein [Verrucomicrobiales bacterium]